MDFPEAEEAIGILNAVPGITPVTRKKELLAQMSLLFKLSDNVSVHAGHDRVWRSFHVFLVTQNNNIIYSGFVFRPDNVEKLQRAIEEIRASRSTRASRPTNLALADSPLHETHRLEKREKDRGRNFTATEATITAAIIGALGAIVAAIIATSK